MVNRAVSVRFTRHPSHDVRLGLMTAIALRSVVHGVTVTPSPGITACLGKLVML